MLTEKETNGAVNDTSE